MEFTINPLSPTAAEITGLDCAQVFDAATDAKIKQAFADYPALIFREQKLSAPELAAFGRNFGKLEEYPAAAAMSGAYAVKPPLAALAQTTGRKTPDQTLYRHPDDAGVLIMTNEALPELPPIGIVDNAETWHSDGSHKPEPYKAIIVHVIQNPKTGGGDTAFSDLRRAYDALNPEIKTLLNGRYAIHHWSKSLNPRFADQLDDKAREEGARIARQVPEMRQPLVRTHPDTGRSSLYLSPRFTLRIDGLPADQSEAILTELFRFAESPDFCYRHTWRENDLMIWDNRCLNHCVHAYEATDTRRRHRVTVTGDRAFYRPAP
jgi:taurine dioxygenase